MRSFAIMVDSSADVPDEYIKEYGIQVMPMPFTLDGREYGGGYWQEISPREYYDAQRNGGVASTSQINIGTFIRLFTEYAEQGKGLVFLLLSSGLSGTFRNAELALEEVKETYPDCNIYPIDSLNATAGHGLLAILAARKGEEGLSAGETAAWLNERKHSVFALFMVDDLMYLHRGGRLSRLSAVAGDLLGVKPMLQIAQDGTLKIKEKVRGRKAAVERLVTQFQRGLNPDTVAELAIINHTDCEGEAKQLAAMLEETGRVRKTAVMPMGPVIGAHLGPGAVTLVFAADMARAEYNDRFYKG